MTKLLAPAALILSLAVGSAAFAATAPAAPAPAQKAPSAHAKKAACEKAWKAQKTRTGSEKEFVKACVAKG